MSNPGPAILQPTCPWCGQPPAVWVSPTQAACSNDDCRCLFWDPTVTAAQNLSDPGTVDIPGVD